MFVSLVKICIAAIPAFRMWQVTIMFCRCSLRAEVLDFVCHFYLSLRRVKRLLGRNWHLGQHQPTGTDTDSPIEIGRETMIRYLVKQHQGVSVLKMLCLSLKNAKKGYSISKVPAGSQVSGHVIETKRQGFFLKMLHSKLC